MHFVKKHVIIKKSPLLCLKSKNELGESELIKKWKTAEPDQKIVNELKKGSDLSSLCCKVLAAQNCSGLKEAEAFLGCRELSNPALLCDMKQAAEMLNQAIEQETKICVYGDYDCDGVMSTVILYSFLWEMGANVTWRIPERHEGYGLNKQAVREMYEDGVELIVTVDNGIAALSEADLIDELGMKLIVTDHHQPGEELPTALAVVDAHRADNYSPFRLYCGAGIALLLVAAMNHNDVQMAMEQFGDLAAIATIADVVALTGENRFLVQRGMEYLENTERPGLLALRKVSGLDKKPLTSVGIAFGIAPRINAAGRLASPKMAVELILEEDPEKAEALAEQLNEINAQRKETEAKIVQEVEAQISQHPEILHERVLVFSGEDWHSGVIGIVASRIQERYGKPCFMISVHDGMGHGSARSFGKFHVFRALNSCADLMEKFGGHPAAGGFTLKEQNIPEFRKRLAQYAREQHPEMSFMEIQAVCTLTPEILTPEAVQSLEQLAPFGAENPEPVFLAKSVLVQDIRSVGTTGEHTRLSVQIQGQNYAALFFRRKPEEIGIRTGQYCHMMVKLNVNTFNHVTSVALYVQEIRPVGIQQARILNAIRVYDRYCLGETLPIEWYKAMMPDRDELICVYQALTETPVLIESLAASEMILNKNINFCKIQLILDAFAEMHLVEIQPITGEVKKLPVKQKINLENSRILNDLKQKLF